MPDLDGYEVLRRLKEDARTSSIYVVFITGLDTPEAEERGLSEGASDYVTKPFHPTVVKARVALHMQVVRQRRMLETLAKSTGSPSFRTVASSTRCSRQNGQVLN